MKRTRAQRRSLAEKFIRNRYNRHLDISDLRFLTWQNSNRILQPLWDEPHRLSKHDPMGHCSNKRCNLCAMERKIKHLNKKRERIAARKQITQQLEQGD